MNEALPATVYKSIVGAIGIRIAGLAAVVLALYAFGTATTAPGTNPVLVFALAVLVVASIVALTIITGRIYSLSYFMLSQEGVTVVQWSSLFTNQKVTTEWRDIEDVTAKTSGVLGQLFDVGTVQVQTAGTKQNLRLTFTPDPQKWQDVIDYYQKQAPANPALSTGV